MIPTTSKNTKDINAANRSLHCRVSPLRFMEIYYAVNPQEPPDNWRPEEKRRVVSVANKTKCVVETLRAMSFFPGDWKPSEHKAITRALWPNKN